MSKKKRKIKYAYDLYNPSLESKVGISFHTRKAALRYKKQRKLRGWYPEREIDTETNPITLPHVQFAIWGYAHGKTMFWNGRTFSPFKKTVEKFASKVAAERKLYWLDDNRSKAPGITTMGVMPL